MKTKFPRPKLIVVGSVALDSIATQHASKKDILGGSASFACAAASFFTAAGMVGIVGRDFPARHTALFRRLGIDLAGLRRVRGKTFRWSGVYERDMNVRRTLATHLNVFESFSPELPPGYVNAPFIFLANISPQLQLRVLEQARRPRFVAADTMDLWIKTERKSLEKVIGKVDMLLINDSEALDLTGCRNAVAAAKRLMNMGPSRIVIKKGEHGSMLFSRKSVFLMPAFPVAEVHDPTGAGDSFAGGLMGKLAGLDGLTESCFRQAILAATVMGSFCVEGFSLDGLKNLSKQDIAKRSSALRAMT